MTEKIDQFKDEFIFLSNFYPSPIFKDGIHYATVEHFYQAHKVLDKAAHQKIAQLKTADQTKKAGRSCKLRSDWEKVKEKVMWEALELKFKPGSTLAEMLLTTDGFQLVEGNYWGDTYWGVDLKTNKGKNRLGKLLMKLRKQLKTGEGNE